MNLKIVHIKEEEENSDLQPVSKRKIPMHKDPRFLYELRKAIIEDHNAKVKKKKAAAANGGSENN